MWYKNTIEHLVGTDSSGLFPQSNTKIKKDMKLSNWSGTRSCSVDRRLVGATTRIQTQNRTRTEGRSFSQFQREQNQPSGFSPSERRPART